MISPSATVTIAVTERLERMPRGTQLLAVGNPAPGMSGLDALPWAEQEVNEIGAGYAGTSTVLVGQQATRPALLERLPHADIFHFAGHSVIDGARTDRSQLMVFDSAGQGVTAADIQHADCHHLRLVVLAACSSASGPVSRSEGPLSLVRPFLMAGASNVVAARSVVADRPSRALFVEFHAQYRTSGNAASALQQAQLLLVRSTDSELSDPKSWAAFSAFGALVR